MGEINWTLYNTRLNIDGSTYRDRNINRLKQNILDKAPDSISYKTVKINNTDANLLIIDTDKINSKDIKSLPDESFSAGDYVDTEHEFEADFFPGVRCDFYIDGVLKNSLATTLPSGTISAFSMLCFYLMTLENVTKSVEVYYYDFWQSL